jgi:hypothetical protein
MTGEDLTGRWIGRYTYASGTDSVPFEAELWQTGRTLEGRIVEPNTFQPDAGPELSAQLMGWAADGRLVFTKRYSGLPMSEHPEYEGQVLRDGRRIEGTWRFPGKTWWTGGFSMSRKPRAEAKAKREAGAEV